MTMPHITIRVTQETPRKETCATIRDVMAALSTALKLDGITLDTEVKASGCSQCYVGLDKLDVYINDKDGDTYAAFDED